MGDALILQKTYIKKTFSEIKLTEANSTGYGNSSSQDLVWTADEACTIIMYSANDEGVSNLKGSYTITGTYKILYDAANSTDTLEARHRCVIAEVSAGSVITFACNSGNRIGRAIVKIPLTKLKITKLNFSRNTATGGNQLISTNSGTAAGLSYEKNHAYLCVGEMGYHDLSSPESKGISISQTNCTYSYITRGAGSASASYNATLASSPTGTAWGWSAAGCGIFIPTTDSSSTFNLNPYLNKSYQSGAWAATWTFEIWQN